jgi:glucose/arabinose dehydrogenase
LGDAPVDARTLKPFATGLRNSMALAVLPDGRLLAAVNARDAIDQADPTLSDDLLPHDTLDLIEPSADYGWPYCFDDNRAAPEYKHYDCSSKHRPTLLLPPHAAPLGMLLYHGSSLPFDGKIIIGYHGYRAEGHRIVALSLDGKDLPEREPQNILWGWNAAPGDHPQGSPVSLYERSDGSVLMTEDTNGTLLRLARE